MTSLLVSLGIISLLVLFIGSLNLPEEIQYVSRYKLTNIWHISRYISSYMFTGQGDKIHYVEQNKVTYYHKKNIETYYLIHI